jgi:hypothetical protein
MKLLLTKLVSSAGYRDVDHFINSAFHPNCASIGAGISAVLASAAYYFNSVFGIVLPVGIAIIILYILEFYTGMKASTKEGKKFDSELFGKGWFKLLVYMIMIGTSNAMSHYIPVKPMFGITFNIYEWLHYGFYNYVIINLFLSNLENLKRLGWTEYLPILKYLAKFVKDEPIKPKKDGENS